MNKFRIGFIKKTIGLIPPLPILKELKSQAEGAIYGYKYFTGVPQEKTLKFAYWGGNTNLKPPINQEMNPARDNCGIVWYSCLVAHNGKEMNRCYEFLKAQSGKLGFDPVINSTSYGKHGMVFLTGLFFDKEKNPNKGEEMLIKLTDEGLKEGFVPYRLANPAMKLINDKYKDAFKINDTLKKCLDPDNIISPGKYGGFRE